MQVFYFIIMYDCVLYNVMFNNQVFKFYGPQDHSYDCFPIDSKFKLYTYMFVSLCFTYTLHM